ncbi:MAG: response regulator transcription factor, partial [Bacillota bacterium]|nr:response regulator transcription factor [Bacillota bacterium]
VQTILRRAGKLKQEEVLSFNNGQLQINIPRYQVEVGGKEVELTPIEFKLLVGMARSPGRVYSRLELLEKVQPDMYEGYERSIDVHIKNLRKKIEQNTKNPNFIITVFGMGYKFGGKPHATYPKS